ncbi:hypothetical protein ENBRE01_2527 [Enteropsectra breve]|nr:hypothetical protein ENBRE01_2527 [Enteropsectra breve]
MNKYMDLFAVPAFIAIFVIVLIIHKLFFSGDDIPGNGSGTGSPVKHELPLEAESSLNNELPLEVESSLKNELPLEAESIAKNDKTVVNEQPNTNLSANKKNSPIEEIITVAHREQKMPEHSAKRPYMGETAPFGNTAEIEERANIMIANYQSLTPGARIHFNAEMLVRSFFKASIKVECYFDFDPCFDSCFDNATYFMEKEHVQGRVLRHPHERCMESNSQMPIPYEEIEEDYEDSAGSNNNACPINRVLFRLNKECIDLNITDFMGISGAVHYKFKDKAQNIHDDSISHHIPVLDVMKTRKSMRGDLTLEQYLRDIKYPVPDILSGCELLSVENTYSDKYRGILVFYSDPNIKPSMYMPESFYCYEYFYGRFPLYPRFFTLSAVIIVDGERNDVFNMKVLHRSKEGMDEFVRVANEKGYYFSYTMGWIGGTC